LEKGGYDRLFLSVRCFLLNPYKEEEAGADEGLFLGCFWSMRGL